MAIDFTKELVSVGVGVVDPALQGWDAKSGRTGMFKTATDIVRLVGAVGGLGLQQFMPRQAKWGEALALSFTPLLIATLAGQAIKDAINPPGTTMFVPRGGARTAPTSTVFAPPNQPSGYRSI